MLDASTGISTFEDWSESLSRGRRTPLIRHMENEGSRKASIETG